MQRMVGGKAHVALAEYHHWNGTTLRQGDEMPDRLRIPSHRARNDQGAFGCRQDRRRRLNGLGVWIEASTAVTARRGRHAELGVWFTQDLAGQGQIDWPSGLGHSDFKSTIDHRFELRKITQLVVPLHILAYHASL